MSNFSIKIRGDALPIFRKFSSSKKAKAFLFEVIAVVFGKQAHVTAGHVIRTQLSGKKGPSFPRPGSQHKRLKQRRTGNLARSVTGVSVRENGVPTLRVGVLRGPATRYAGIQELGTKKYNPDSPFDTIRPTSSDNLAVPVGEGTATGAGVNRFDGPRSFPEPLIPMMFNGRRGKNANVTGKLVLLREWLQEQQQAALEGRRPSMFRLDAVYLLLSHMDIRPGFFLADGVQDYLPDLAKACVAGVTAELTAK